MQAKRSLIVLNVLLLFLMWHISSCGENSNHQPSEEVPQPTSVESISFDLIKKYPHDKNAFTEGLFFKDGKLFESTGATENLPSTRSLFGIVDTQSGKIQVKAELDKTKYFGEGIAHLNGKIYQLTYQTKIGFIYDANSFKKIGEFTFPSAEGWGLTTDGTYLIMSDGTNTLTYLTADSLKVVKSIKVLENGYAKDNLNELEYVDGYIYANVWMTSSIVKIDPNTGQVIASIDAASLAADAKRNEAGSQEMNGIAYHPQDKTWWVTGKMWPTIYVIKLAK